MARTATTTDLDVRDVGDEGAGVFDAPTRWACADASLEGELRSRLAGWLADPPRTTGVEVVKATRLRRIVRVPAQAPLPALFVKLHRVRGRWNALRSAVQRSRARREHEASERLREIGFLAPRVLAYAEWRRGPVLDRAVSVLEEVAGGRRLDEWLGGFDGAAREEAIGAVARLLSVIHHRGVDLVDCHRGNLLALGDSPESLRLALLDLAEVRFRPLGLRTRAERVGQLGHSLRGFLSRPELQYLTERYAGAASMSAPDRAELTHRVEVATAELHARRERSRDRRCVLDSTDFAAERGLRRRVFRRRELPGEVLGRILSFGRTARELERRGARVVHDEGRSLGWIVPREAVGAEGGGAFFVKQVRARSIAGACVDALRGSRGRRAWSMAHALARRGLATPRAHALVEEGFGIPLRTLLVTDALEDSVSLRHVASEFRERFPDLRSRRSFLERLGLEVARLHLHGVDHDDLATKNLLVRSTPQPSFWVIDLEAVRSIGRKLPRGRLLRALMQLDDCPRTVSRVDRMRFLVAYEQGLQTRFTRSDLAEVRRMLRDRFRLSGRDYGREGPR